MGDVLARFFQGFSNEYAAWKPNRYKGSQDSAIGSIGAEFEGFVPDPKYADARMPKVDHDYPLIVPRAGAHLPPINPILKSLVETLWKRAQPATGATRGNIQIGGRRDQAFPQRDAVPQRDAYVAQTRGASVVDFSNTTSLVRTNAVTLRGDTRGPQEIIVGNGVSGGFNPPNTRTDDYYIYGPVFNAFKGYMKNRFGVDITMADYVSAVAGSAPSAAAKHVFADYIMWRAVMESEALHIGNMVSNELLKAYISTSRSLVIARNFGHRFGAVSDAWIYVCYVQGGFTIPPAGSKWGTVEQEIAQLGPLPPVNIVGFKKSSSLVFPGAEPIYVRRKFRKTEPEAFRRVFEMLSGSAP